MSDTATSQPTGDLDAQSLEPTDGSTEQGGQPKPSTDPTKAGRPATRPPKRKR